MVSRTQTGGNGSTTTQGPSTQTQTQGPSTQTQSGSQSGSSSTSGKSKETTTYNIQNMTDQALGALDDLIAGLAGGGNAAANQLRDQWLNELQAAQQLREDYSKANAIKDSDAAMASSMAKALEQAMPTIAAGIDAAGTSGGAMSALLTQKAAEAAANQAAELGLSAAISYGQIAVNAGNTAASLINTGDPTLNALLQALATAKGAVQQGSQTTNKTYSENSSSQSQSNSTTQNSGSTTVTQNSGGTSTVTPNAPTAGPMTNLPQKTTGAGSNSQQWITPSAYQTGGSTNNGSGVVTPGSSTSYSQFR